MLGLLIFNHLNDVLYMYGIEKFLHHIRSIALSQQITGSTSINPIYQNYGGVGDLPNADQESVDPNIIVQLFSPLITSQQVMDTQFSNSYVAINCEDGTNLVFLECGGCHFLAIGSHSYTEIFLERFINISVQLVQLTVGICIPMLKCYPEKRKLLDRLLSSWLELYSCEQSYLVEAIERLVVSQDVALIAMNTLSAIIDKMKQSRHICPGHAMFFVRNKLLSLYSSKESADLTGSDLLLLNLLAQAVTLKDEPLPQVRIPIHSDAASPASDDGGIQEEAVNDISPEPPPEGDPRQCYAKEFLLLLKTPSSDLVPHVVHFYAVASDWSLIIVMRVKQSEVSTELLNLIYSLDALRREGWCPSLVKNVDEEMKRAEELAESLPEELWLKIQRKFMQVSRQWESLKGSWTSLKELEFLSRAEAGLAAMLETAKATWQYATMRQVVPNANVFFEKVSRIIREKGPVMSPIVEKALVNASSPGSCSIMSINKYLEEFPGLVHFLYIDRSIHQLTAPSLWAKRDLPKLGDGAEYAEAVRYLTTSKIWSMVDFARKHLREGHTAIIWKDKTFSYSYFLWFEDSRGNPLSLIPPSGDTLDGLPIPGVIREDFYAEFSSVSFSSNDIKPKIYELFSIHLGAVTSPCILEQTRRLAATVLEIAGPPSVNPVELL